MPKMRNNFDHQIVIIALAFIGIPLLAAWYLIGLPIQQWRLTQHWVEVPAIIETVKLQEHHSSGSITYESNARYRYQFDGQEYVGDRVSLYGPEDGTSYHRVIVRELEEHRDSQQPFRCFVDPYYPKDSLLYRDIRWGMYFMIGLIAILFSGVGVWMLGNQLHHAIKALRSGS
ncbi:DUF3592 domain-containing protein [Alcanivorax sp. S6407]|uniref:DUF3592 domain-containing protein n=1 Tax=Alcanivorax sp. S6407 TaxID=2926424 RepID=UPI001FF5EF17|nr:DUF3592 domain-containing protein [Alcanivorax sp. S6407]MCK0154502.1 DUF3592 domain-containing protein [Alcanivorax sp. S6407]